MSSILLPHAHINALISWATTHQIVVPLDGEKLLDLCCGPADSQKAAQMLADQNQNDTIRYCYSLRAASLPPIAIIKLCDCYDYQTAAPGYFKTHAHRIINYIRSEAIHLLPGYEAAPWVYDPRQIQTAPDAHLEAAFEDRSATD